MSEIDIDKLIAELDSANERVGEFTKSLKEKPRTGGIADPRRDPPALASDDPLDTDGLADALEALDYRPPALDAGESDDQPLTVEDLVAMRRDLPAPGFARQVPQIPEDMSPDEIAGDERDGDTRSEPPPPAPSEPLASDPSVAAAAKHSGDHQSSVNGDGSVALLSGVKDAKRQQGESDRGERAEAERLLGRLDQTFRDFDPEDLEVRPGFARASGRWLVATNRLEALAATALMGESCDLEHLAALGDPSLDTGHHRGSWFAYDFWRGLAEVTRRTWPRSPKGFDLRELLSIAIERSSGRRDSIMGWDPLQAGEVTAVIGDAGTSSIGGLQGAGRAFHDLLARQMMGRSSMAIALLLIPHFVRRECGTVRPIPVAIAELRRHPEAFREAFEEGGAAWDRFWIGCCRRSLDLSMKRMGTVRLDGRLLEEAATDRRERVPSDAIVDFLYRHPVFTLPRMVQELDISQAGAQNVTARLLRQDKLVKTTRWRASHLWKSRDVLSLR
jgi:hypothetical protein